MQSAAYTKITVEYAQKLAAGEIQQSTIPRTPTVTAAYEYHKLLLKEHGTPIADYIIQEVLKGEDRLLQLSPFPYVCEIGIDHYLYWMRGEYEPVDSARLRISEELGAELDQIYIIRNTTQSVPEVPHYQVFINSNNDNIHAPYYELNGQEQTLEEYATEWENLLGYPVNVQFNNTIIWNSPLFSVNDERVKTFIVRRRHIIQL